jgi:FKBP-type peptidyl-prolyl cis-trans isomerase
MKRAILFAALLSATGCGGPSTSASTLPPTSVAAQLTTTDIVVGTGATAASGSRVVTTYAGWLYDTGKPNGKGNSFDPGPGPLTFTIGAGTLIRGFEQGVIGMQVGGQRRVVIPPDLAYGANSPDPTRIPANASLVFEIALSSVQ